MGRLAWQPSTRMLRCLRPSVSSRLFGAATTHNLQQPLFATAMPTRRFGILDRGREFLEKRNDSKRDEMFRQQMEDLLQHDKFHLKLYRDSLHRSMDQVGWKSYVPGVKKTQEYTELAAQVNFFTFMGALAVKPLGKP